MNAQPEHALISIALIATVSAWQIVKFQKYGKQSPTSMFVYWLVSVFLWAVSFISIFWPGFLIATAGYVIFEIWTSFFRTRPVIRTVMTGVLQERAAALVGIRTMTHLAIQSAIDNDSCADDDETPDDVERQCIESIRRHLTTLGVTESELDAAGIKVFSPAATGGLGGSDA